MDRKNPRMETKGDNEKYGEVSKKMGRRHKNSSKQTVDEIGETQRMMETIRRDIHLGMDKQKLTKKKKKILHFHISTAMK